MRVFDPSFLSSKDRNFLDPGKPSLGVVAAEPGLHSLLLIEMVTPNALDVAQLKLQTSKAANELESLRATVKWLEPRIKSWNVTSENSDEPLPVTADFMLKMPPLLLAKLISLAQGFRPNDELPQAQAQTESQAD